MHMYIHIYIHVYKQTFETSKIVEKAENRNAQTFYHFRYKTKGQAGVIVKQFALNDDTKYSHRQLGPYSGKCIQRSITRKIVTFVGAIALISEKMPNVATNERISNYPI